MAYITISIILLILFLDVGLQIEHNNNTKIYLLISSLKIKLNLKSFDRFIEEASHKTSKENVDNFKKNLSLVKPIKHIMAGATIDYIDIIRFDDLTDIKLISPFLTYNGYYLINDLINEIISYKLKQRIDQLRKEQKQLENEGKIEESIKLAIELASITKKLKEAKRV